MCGIAGAFSLGDLTALESGARRGWELLSHRGPDDEGTLVWQGGETRAGREWQEFRSGPGLHLAHRRLSIIDLTDGGWQPMQRGALALVFNGEIYNYRELRTELAALGHRFQTDSDTEVLLAAFEQWGTGALKRLVGMFAFALLDRKSRQLYLVRDFFGIKPLVTATRGTDLVFASETKALLAHSWVDRALRPDRLFDYLRFGHSDQGQETLLKGVGQVPPAHFMTVSLDTGERELTRYWRAESQPIAFASYADATRQLREKFLESVQLHLRSDVTVGSALSGGLDSSAIVGAIRHLEPQRQIQSFSFVADHAPLDESGYARAVVEHNGLQPHWIRVSPEELRSDLASLIALQDEPFASTSIYAQFRVFQQARAAGVKVMLDGQGADELLGGYQYLIGARMASLLRQHRYGKASRLWRSSQNWDGMSPWLGAQWTLDFMLSPRWQSGLRRVVGRELVPDWMDGKWFEERGVQPSPRKFTSGPHVLRDQLERLREDTSLPHLLRYEDRNSMGFSIESRVPFLNPRLAEFVVSLPEEYLVGPDGTQKRIFRDAMEGIVPTSVIQRRDKLGFVTPESQWMKHLGHHMDWQPVKDGIRQLACLDTHRSLEWVEQVEAGTRGFDGRLWRLVNLTLWAQQVEAHVE